MERKPERLPDLLIGNQWNRVGHMEDEGRDHELSSLVSEAVEVVEPAEGFGRIERQPDLLEGLALGRGARGGVDLANPPAGECHVAGPGVSRANRAFDQQHLEGAAAAPEHDRHLGALCGLRVQYGGAMAEQRFPDFRERIHRREHSRDPRNAASRGASTR